MVGKRPLNSRTPNRRQVKGIDARGLILQCTGNEKLFSVLFHFVFGCPSTLLSRKETCHICIDKYLLTCTSECIEMLPFGSLENEHMLPFGSWENEHGARFI